MKKLVFLILFISSFRLSLGQTKWTYQECILYALENNLELVNYNYLIDRHKLNYKSALGNFLPSVSADAGYNINIGKTVDPNTNSIIERDFFSNSYGISGSLVLFSGFRKFNQLSFEKYNLAATKETVDSEKNRIAFQVLEAYTLHLIQKRLWEIQNDQVDLAKQELYRIEKNMELGLVSGSELRDAEARLAQDEFLLVQFHNQQKKSEFSLKRLMNLPVDSSILVEDIDMIANSSGQIPDSLYQQAQVILPSIKALNYQLEAAKKSVSTAKSYLSPTLSVYGGINTGYYETLTNEQGDIVPFRSQMDNNMRMNYGLSLQIPIFSGFQRRINIQQSTVARAQAKNNLDIGLRNLNYEIDEAIIDLTGAEAEYESALKKEESMVIAFRIAERRREEGLINLMEYFEVKNNLARASAEVVRTKLQLFMMERTINFYLTGSLIEE